MKKNVHVVHNSERNKWQVKVENEHAPLAELETKEEAIEKGREFAKEYESELVIHRMDGVITEKSSFGNDPKNIKG